MRRGGPGWSASCCGRPNRSDGGGVASIFARMTTIFRSGKSVALVHSGLFAPPGFDRPDTKNERNRQKVFQYGVINEENRYCSFNGVADRIAGSLHSRPTSCRQGGGATADPNPEL